MVIVEYLQLIILVFSMFLVFPTNESPMKPLTTLFAAAG